MIIYWTSQQRSNMNSITICTHTIKHQYFSYRPKTCIQITFFAHAFSPSLSLLMQAILIWWKGKYNFHTWTEEVREIKCREEKLEQKQISSREEKNGPEIKSDFCLALFCLKFHIRGNNNAICANWNKSRAGWKGYGVSEDGRLEIESENILYSSNSSNCSTVENVRIECQMVGFSHSLTWAID